MWCAKCQSEVAVEVRPNSQRLQCATCGTEILPKMSGRLSPVPPGSPSSAESPDEPDNGQKGPPPTPTISGRSPQELLARWAGQQIFDPYGPLIPQGPPKNTETPKPENLAPAQPTQPVPQAPPAPAQTPPPQSPGASNVDPLARFRVDPAFTEGWSEVPAPHVSTPLPHAGARKPKLVEQEMPEGYRAHPPARLKGPHFDPARVRAPIKKLGWVGTFGQILAYVGAATLTIGAALVLVGYLGGPIHFAPTGWFTTIVGQMLLFLGVVTLVSAGMEQTTVEVAERIDTLGEQLDRMEYRTQSQGPAADPETEAQLRAEIAHLRQQLSEQSRG